MFVVRICETNLTENMQNSNTVFVQIKDTPRVLFYILNERLLLIIRSEIPISLS